MPALPRGQTAPLALRDTGTEGDARERNDVSALATADCTCGTAPTFDLSIAFFGVISGGFTMGFLGGCFVLVCVLSGVCFLGV